MVYKIFTKALLASAILMTGCGEFIRSEHNSDEARVTGNPKIRQVDGIAKPALRDHNLEERCDALKAFIRGYLTQYSVAIDLSTVKCDKWFASLNSSLTSKDARADQIELFLRPTGSTLSAKSIRIRGLNSPNPTVDLSNAPPLDQDFKSALLAYLEGSYEQRMVFGLDPDTYFDRLSSIGKFQGFGENFDHIQFELTPHPDFAIGAGSVKYVKIEKKYFEPDDLGYLGCADLECLNDGKTRYLLIDEYIVFTRTTDTNPDIEGGERSFQIIKIDPAMLQM